MKPIKFAGIELASSVDVAVAGISYAAGFGVDAFFFSGGVTSGATAGACAAGALGLKYSIQEFFNKRKNKPNN